jgi:uncharacterized coiled-coil protein SlyX
MKTPMQELIDEMTYMLTEGERSIYALREKARKLLEKEKETEMLRASLMKKVSELNDNEIISLYDELSEFFKTKEK